MWSKLLAAARIEINRVAAQKAERRPISGGILGFAVDIRVTPSEAESGFSSSTAASPRA